MVLVAGVGAWGQAAPRFEDFLVADTAFMGKVHPPVYVTAEQERLRGELQIAAVRRPTFAGQYIVVLMECEAACKKAAIVDARDGTIYPSPFGTADSPYALPPPNWDAQWPRFMSLSKLFVVPNVCPGGPASCGSYGFVWEENRFRLVHKVAASATPVIPARSPLVGRWKGEWSYTNGVEVISKPFVLTFTEKGGRVRGSYSEAGGKGSSIDRLTATKVDLSTYRMEIQGACWNVGVAGDSLDGMWNGGPCTSLGLGVGARLIALHAVRE